ncbi:unnamed protein product [Calypogeia fissa]
MIIRTYQRRNRPGRSLSESGNPCGDGVGSSGSQESIWGSSQEPAPFAFPSSQESCWSQSSDYGSSTRSFKSSRRQSYDDDFGEDTLAGMRSRPPISRSISERPAFTATKKNGDEVIPRGKLKKALSDFPDLISNGTRNNTSRELERRHDKDSQESGSSRPKRGLAWGDGSNDASHWVTAAPTSTLMEAQESGEMMEHVDEANFALDGLRQGQPVRIQRASLTSLLSLCCSMQRRRMLRTHGMAKPLLDAIVALPTDDPPLALAAAAVLYLLAIDSQDEDLLDSEPCVRFLMKLLGTQSSQPVVKKGLSAFGSKLAAFAKATVPRSGISVGGVDRGAAVVSKVRELFKSLQEQGTGRGNLSEENGILQGEEISSKWLALLTLEKACISTVVLEDSSAEAVRKVGGRFKERLRELGGLDALSELAASCVGNLKKALKSEDTSDIIDLDLASLEKNEKSGGIGVLLRCLRVMENVTFLSEQNQKHLLELKLSRGNASGTESFIGLTINAINTLSDLAQRQKERKEVVKTEKHLAPSHPQKDTESATWPKGKRQRSLAECFRSSENSEANSKLESEKAEPSTSGHHTTSSLLTFKRRKSSLSSSSQPKSELSERSLVTSALSKDSKDIETEVQNNRKTETVMFRRRSKDKKSTLDDSQDPYTFDNGERQANGGDKPISTNVEDSQDPFSFDEMDLDFKSHTGVKRQPKRERTVKSKLGRHEKKASISSRLDMSEDDGAALEKSDSVEVSAMVARGGPEGENEESRQSTLLGDCLLSGVKVLMNLTNGNPLGCSQVATCGGLNSLSSLLIANYPWPRSPAAPLEGSPARQSEADTEQDLDLLVTVLGVLCNLVEKDIGNRARLASLKVAVPSDIMSTKEGKLWQETGMIGLLCSLFLLKQGSGEAAEAIENKRALEMDEEVKQGQAEAEDMIVEAYTALLLAFLSKESERARMAIAHLLPGDDLKSLVPVLERFVAFHLSLNMISEETHAVVTDVIESCKRPISSRSVI